MRRKYGFFMMVFRTCYGMIHLRAMRRANRAGTIAVWAMFIGLSYASVGFAMGEICKRDFRALAYASIILPIAYDWLIWRQVRMRTAIPSKSALRREVCRTVHELPESMEMDDWIVLYRLGNAVLDHDDTEVADLLKDMEAMPAFAGWQPLTLVKKAFFGRHLSRLGAQCAKPAFQWHCIMQTAVI